MRRPRASISRSAPRAPGCRRRAPTMRNACSPPWASRSRLRSVSIARCCRWKCCSQKDSTRRHTGRPPPFPNPAMRPMPRAYSCLQQQAALRASLPVEAVRAGLARERVATSEAERNTARRDLLTGLRQAIDRGLRVDPAAAREPLIRGWLEVGQIAASASRSPLGANAAIDRWRARFPGHPASTILASEILAPAASKWQGGVGQRLDCPAAAAHRQTVGGRGSGTRWLSGRHRAAARGPASRNPRLRHGHDECQRRAAERAGRRRRIPRRAADARRSRERRTAAQRRSAPAAAQQPRHPGRRSRRLPVCTVSRRRGAPDGAAGVRFRPASRAA